MHEGQWTVEEDVDDDAVYTALAQDRIWSGYAIADLVPPGDEGRAYTTAYCPAARPTASYARNTVTAFWPPKPKPFVIAVFTVMKRAVSGT